MECAKHIVDIERNEELIEVTLLGGKKEWIYTKPKGEWYCIILNGVNYADFLRTMVEPNVEVLRKIAHLELRDTWGFSVRAMRCLRILDPTFDAPYINKKAQWQMDLVCYMNRVVGFSIIDQCDDEKSLISYANRLRALR